MVLARSTRVIAIAATGLCLLDQQRWADAFGIPTKLEISRPSVMRPRVTRVGSAVDIERRNGVVETAWATTEVTGLAAIDVAREFAKRMWSVHPMGWPQNVTCSPVFVFAACARGGV